VVTFVHMSMVALAHEHLRVVLLDIELLDDLIIGDGRWVSLHRLGLGFSAGTV
jgi:hypothetical protein